MDTDTISAEFYLIAMIFLNGVRLCIQLLTLRKQLQNGTITKENLDVSYPVTTLLKLDRYVTEILERYKRKY